MFRWLIGASLQFRFLVLGIAAALVIFGGLRLYKMPVDVLPEFSAPVVEVQTEALGLSAEEVESLITLNLEELLSGVPWVESIRSRSVTGLSSIVLTFKRGTDIMKARQMMQERLTLAYTLPNVAHPPVILQPLSATSRFMMVEHLVFEDRADGTVAARPLDDQAAAARRARCRERGDLGSAAAPTARAHRSEPAARRATAPGRHHRRGRRCPVGFTAHVPERLGAGHRRLDRQPQPAADGPALDAHRSARAHGEGGALAAAPRHVGTFDGDGGYRGGDFHASAAHRRRSGQERHGTAARAGEVSLGQHARGHARRRAGARRAPRAACRGWRSTRASFASPPTCKAPSGTLRSRWPSG